MSPSRLTLAMATVSVLAAAAWWQVRKSQRPNGDANGKNGDTTNNKNSNKGLPSPPPADISPAVEHTFNECAERIRHVTTLSDGDKLFLYALYKQAMVGDAPSDFSYLSGNSSWNVMAAQAKYMSWRKLRGMPRSAAYFQYIATAQIHIEQEESVHEEDTEYADNRTSSGPFTGMSVSVSRYADEAQDDANGEGEADDSSIEESFLAASAANNVAKVRQLIKDHWPQSLDLNHKDDVGQTALHLAADHGAMAVMEFLLNFNISTGASAVDVDAVDEHGISVLQAAVIAGQVEACRLLLLHGADPDLADHDGDTPRNCADDDGSLEMIHIFESTPVMSQKTNGVNGH